MNFSTPKKRSKKKATPRSKSLLQIRVDAMHKKLKGKATKAEIKKALSSLGGKSGVIKISKKQTAVKNANKTLDNKRTAKKPGKRISKNGNIYYENRVNRSDK